MCLGAGEGNRYSSDNDQPSLAIDAKGQLARFVAKTLRVCSKLVVLTYWSSGQRLLLLSLDR